MSDSVIFELIVSFESPNEESACFIAQEVDRLVNVPFQPGDVVLIRGTRAVVRIACTRLRELSAMAALYPALDRQILSRGILEVAEQLEHFHAIAPPHSPADPPRRDPA